MGALQFNSPSNIVCLTRPFGLHRYFISTHLLKSREQRSLNGSIASYLKVLKASDELGKDKVVTANLMKERQDNLKVKEMSEKNFEKKQTELDIPKTNVKNPDPIKKKSVPIRIRTLR